jgi:hypothetical protein
MQTIMATKRGGWRGGDRFVPVLITAAVIASVILLTLD